MALFFERSNTINEFIHLHRSILSSWYSWWPLLVSLVQRFRNLVLSLFPYFLKSFNLQVPNRLMYGRMCLIRTEYDRFLVWESLIEVLSSHVQSLHVSLCWAICHVSPSLLLLQVKQIREILNYGSFHISRSQTEEVFVICERVPVIVIIEL